MRQLQTVAVALAMSQGFASFSRAQERSQARSMVITEGGIAAASQTLASQAGAQILARGGHAVDAAIAANALLAVVEPMMCGMGGDLFAILRDGATGKITGINASGWAGKGMSIDRMREKGFYSMPGQGIHSATVPGAVDGWWRLHQRFGKLSQEYSTRRSPRVRQ